MGQRSGRPEDGITGSFRSEMEGMADPGVPARRPRRRGAAAGASSQDMVPSWPAAERVCSVCPISGVWHGRGGLFPGPGPGRAHRCPAGRLPRSYASVASARVAPRSAAVRAGGRGPSLRRATTAGRTGFGAEPRYGGDDDVARDGRDAFGRGHECGRRCCWCRPARPHWARRPLIRVSRPAPPCDQRDGQHRQPVGNGFGAERH